MSVYAQELFNEKILLEKKHPFESNKLTVIVACFDAVDDLYCTTCTCNKNLQ